MGAYKGIDPGPLLGEVLRFGGRWRRLIKPLVTKAVYCKRDTENNSDCKASYWIISVPINNCSSEGKTDGQLQWTRGSLEEALRTLNAPDTGERPAGVQVKEKGVVNEAKTESRGEKERGELKWCQLTPASESGSCSPCV